MTNLLQQLHQRPIAYYPIYRNVTGSTTAAVLLSQLMFWFSKKDKFFKTNEDIMKETMLTENELRTAKKVIKDLPFIIVTREQIPAKTFYKIDWEIYEMHLNHVLPSSSVDSTQLDELNPRNSTRDNHSTTTKTTTKTTSKNSLPPLSEEQSPSASDKAPSKRGDLKSFKKKFLKNYHSQQFFMPHQVKGFYLLTTPFILNDNDYIVNTVNNKILSSEESFIIWNALSQYKNA